MAAQSVVWLNGELMAADEAQVPARDRGLLYGDGLFETVRVYRGLPFRLEAHLNRLFGGAQQLNLTVPYSAEELTAAAQSAITASQLAEAYLRITLTRGVGGRPAELGAAQRPTVIILVSPLAGYPTELYELGMTAAISSIRRNETSPLSRIKSLNYLDNILARADANARGYDEALLVNSRGALTEASAANLFVVHAGAVVTPPVADGVLPGITRQVVMELIPVQERSLKPEELFTAEEAFLTNSLMEVMPLVAVEGRKIGAGQPGPITTALLRRYRELLT